MGISRALAHAWVAAVAVAAGTVGPTAHTAAPTPASWSVAQPGVSATGCDGVRATLSLSSAGRLTLGAGRDCATVLEPAAVGLVTAAVDLSTALTFVGRTERVIEVAYTTTAGKSRQRRFTATESRFRFTGADGTRITVIVRVSADGIAYRYELPAAATVLREVSTFRVPVGADAFLSPYMAYYENQYAATTAGAAATG